MAVPSWAVNPIIGYVQLSTGSQQSGGFNTSTGTVGQLTLSSNGVSTAPAVGFQSDSAGMGMYRYIQPTWSIASSSWNVGTSTIYQPSHGLYNGAPVLLTTTGGLPGGLSIGTTYYVLWIDPNDFALVPTGSSIAKIAFSTQGSGIHTVTPLAAHDLNLSVNGIPIVDISTGAYWSAAAPSVGQQFFIGTRYTVTQPSELLHVEGAGNVSGDTAADIAIYNTSIYGARVLAQANALYPAQPAVLAAISAHGSGDSGFNYWTGQNQANSTELTLQNSTPAVIRVIGGGTTTYFYNDNTSAQWIYNHGATGTTDFTITNKGSGPLTQTLAQLATSTPTFTMEMVGCSDCTTDAVCVGTQTVTAKWSRISSKATACQ